MTKEEYLKDHGVRIPEGWFLVPENGFIEEGDKIVILIGGNWIEAIYNIGNPILHHIIIRKESENG